MASTTTWPTFSASDTPLDTLVKLSRFYGSDPEFVLAGGGNTSVKVGDRLFVKGSGHALATIPPEGFVEMDRQQLEALLNSALSEDRMRREAEFKRRFPNGGPPSEGPGGPGEWRRGAPRRP